MASQVSQTETKVDTITARLEQIYSNLQNRISELDIDLRMMINNRIWGPEFNKKEAKIRKLKAELARIDTDKAQPSLFTKTQSIPILAPLFTSYQPFYYHSVNLRLFKPVFFARLYNPKTAFLSLKRVPNQIRKQLKTVSSVLIHRILHTKASVEHTNLVLNKLVFKIFLILFLIYFRAP